MGAFADWMANKLEGRARLKAGAFDVPEAVRDAWLLGNMPLYANNARAAAPAIMSNAEALQAREWVPGRNSGHLSGIQDMDFADKFAMSRRSPFSQQDPMQTGPSLSGVGAYEGPKGIETNPMQAVPYNALPSNADVAGLVALLTQHEEG